MEVGGLPPTAPVNAMYGLHESLTMLLEEGLNRVGIAMHAYISS